jgi:GNAT superfamily N-acetyltransferase
VIRVGTAPADFGDWTELHALLAQVFGPNEGRTDPPSSLLHLTPGDLGCKVVSEVLILAHDGERLVGCAFCAPKTDCLYLGRIVVAPSHRRHGLLHGMLTAADDSARARGLTGLCLRAGVGLTENHGTFAAPWFRRAGTEAHPGFDRPTSVIFRRPVPSART